MSAEQSTADPSSPGAYFTAHLEGRLQRAELTSGANADMLRDQTEQITGAVNAVRQAGRTNKEIGEMVTEAFSATQQGRILTDAIGDPEVGAPGIAIAVSMASELAADNEHTFIAGEMEFPTTEFFTAVAERATDIKAGETEDWQAVVTGMAEVIMRTDEHNSAWTSFVESANQENGATLDALELIRDVTEVVELQQSGQSEMALAA